ncbi:hypothetical protein KR074_001899 [Drosophila pseudoananassae]|nr:hypothetical protein KR074_001899 [Drosophila pseudoananassae]
MPTNKLRANMSYREVIPKNLSPPEWIDVKINTGTQSTLQDLKTFESSGGYCYKSRGNAQNRNRFIYWRTHQDVLELVEISLDISLQKNHLRLRFTDSAVLNVFLKEDTSTLNLLVVTVSSVHRYAFPLKTAGLGGLSEDQTSQSIFYDVNEKINDPSSFYVTDGFGNLPSVAVSYLSQDSQTAYFAVAYQEKLLLHVMNCATGQTVTNEIKEPHLMPRFLSNLKGALIGRSEALEAAISMAFSEIEGQFFLLVLYRNNEMRLWSLDNIQTLASINCSSGSTHGGSATQGPQSNQLRKINDQDFCLFLSHDIGSEFICVSIMPDAEDVRGLKLVVQHSLSAPQMDLADFDATSSHIWALWSNAEGDYHVSAIYLGSNDAIKWVSAALEPPPDRYSLNLERGIDPRQAYCSYIFYPGRFDRNIIAKALYMFRRVNMQFDVKQLSMSMLKDQVCQAVEDEIQNELKDYVVSDDEYLEIATRLWDKFYSCCEQYYMKFSEPTGLAVLEGMDAVCLVRRQSFSLLRPCEVLEHLLLIGEHNEEVATYVAPLFRNNPATAKGFVDLMNVITLLDKLISEDIKMELDNQLYQRASPLEVISKLVTRITVGDDNGPMLPSNCVKQMSQKLQEIPNLKPAVDVLLDVLCMIDPDAPRNDYSGCTRFLQPTGALFGSEYGLSILAETVRQMAMIRFSVCRNLLVLQFMVYGGDGMDSECMQTNINYLNCYYTLMWISETAIPSNTPAGFEASIQRLSRAQLFNGYTRPYASHLRNHGHDQTTLLSLFLQSKGLFCALTVLLKNSGMQMETEQLNLRQSLLQLVGFINKILWPESPEYIFLEWLFGTCHHIIVQDYVRILSNWCKENTHSRRFMLAVSLLDCGEAHKAVDLFQHTAEGILLEDFLFEHVLKNTPIYSNLQEVISNKKVSLENVKLAKVHYYLKVIQLFEQHSALDYIIQIAHLAMNVLRRDDPQLPMFQSIVFNNHLQLGHYEEAYHALVYNADISRRKDCLRQLVITLFQSKSLHLLMQFPYTGLQDEFESIVESRARSISIDQNEVYNFLYAFHTNKGNMRKAATVMFEQAMRLQVDSDAPNALEKRCSSLLIAINCLHLVDHRYRWIAKPTIGDEQVAPMNEDQDNQDGVLKGQEVVVLELEDIRRELVHAEALLELSHHRKGVASLERITPEELSRLLVSTGLYTSALKLHRGHTFSVLPIFEGLATACVTATEEKDVDAWGWLQNNDLADLPHRNNAADMAWTLLQKLLVNHESKESTLIKKGVVNRLLTLNSFVPQWLIDLYKLANSRELLHLFVKHNRLLEAADLACEMIGAMLGAGCEYFEFKQSVAVTNPQLSFPTNTIDILLHGLKININEDIEYEMAYTKLEEEVQRYIEIVKRTTEDKMSLAILHNREELRQQAQF